MGNIVAVDFRGNVAAAPSLRGWLVLFLVQHGGGGGGGGANVFKSCLSDWMTMAFSPLVDKLPSQSKSWRRGSSDVRS